MGPINNTRKNYVPKRGAFITPMTFSAALEDEKAHDIMVYLKGLYTRVKQDPGMSDFSAREKNIIMRLSDPRYAMVLNAHMRILKVRTDALNTQIRLIEGNHDQSTLVCDLDGWDDCWGRDHGLLTKLDLIDKAADRTKADVLKKLGAEIKKFGKSALDAFTGTELSHG